MGEVFCFEGAIAPFVFKLGKFQKEQNLIEKETHRLINEYRKQMGLVELEWDVALRDVSMPHNKFLTKAGYGTDSFEEWIIEDGKKTKQAHKGFQKRFNYCAKNLNRRTGRENVLMCSAEYDNPAQTAVEGWKNSPGHNENILTPEMRREGIAVLRNSKGYFFTQLLTD